jgi:ribose-phosphate pyrophosphokinase
MVSLFFNPVNGNCEYGGYLIAYGGEMKEDPISARQFRFFSGSSNPLLAEDIAKYLGLLLDKTHISRLNNDDLYIQLDASVRRRVVHVVQSLSQPVDQHLLELLMMLDIARNNGATEIHAIIPYYSFGRSDKIDAPRISITARLVADLLKTAGATHVMSIGSHSPQVRGFFSIPTDLLSIQPVFRKYLEHVDTKCSIIVAPDIRQATSAERLAESLGLPFAAGITERVSDKDMVIRELVGSQVHGHKCAIIYDYEISTGGTILELNRVLAGEGIEDIKVLCTHGVFSHDGLQRLADVPQISEIVTTDTVYITPEKRHPKLKVLSVAPVFGEAIRHNFSGEVLSDLFVYGLSGDSTTDAPPPPPK